MTVLDREHGNKSHKSERFPLLIAVLGSLTSPSTSMSSEAYKELMRRQSIANDQNVVYEKRGEVCFCSDQC